MQKEGKAASANDADDDSEIAAKLTDFFSKHEEFNKDKDEITGAIERVTKNPRYAERQREVKILMIYSAVGLSNFTEKHAEEVLDILEPEAHASESFESGRVASVDFGITNDSSDGVSLVYQGDLARFEERVNALWEWRREETVHSQYMAPYFPLIQSSGMGKTKLMYDLKKKWAETNPDIHVELILCYIGDEPPELSTGTVFSQKLQVPQSHEEHDRTSLWKKLDSFVGTNEKTLLMFDESHALMEREGWAFRSIRWWLRKERTNKNIVAVFAGTSSKLANFFIEKQPSETSRDNKNKYLGGKELYPPFNEITSTGIYSLMPNNHQNPTEYDLSIQYGRPLFALMHLKGQLDDIKLQNIMGRMGMERNTDLGNFSVLGTRLQMGQVTLDLASDLVASGYAYLAYYSPKSLSFVDIAFLPDPVCARLAMSRMIGDGCNIFDDKKISVQSLSPKEWSERAQTFFTNGLCRPVRGDVGEVAAAFYMLACGDKIRKHHDNTLKAFSIALSKWFAVMKDPKVTLDENSASDTEA